MQPQLRPQLQPAPYPQPETAAACRALLAQVGLANHWTDRGPDELAARWLAAGDLAEDRPTDLTPDQWTLLRVCRALADGEGGPQFAELLVLPLNVACLLGSLVTATAIGAEDAWGRNIV